MKISKYRTEGIARDHEWILDNQWIVAEYLREEMRAVGFVPVLDEDHVLNYWYDAPNEVFKYALTVRGLKLGEEAKKFSGFLKTSSTLLDLEGNKAELVYVV